MPGEPRVLVGISMHPDAMARLQSAATVRVALDYRPLLPEAIVASQGQRRAESS